MSFSWPRRDVDFGLEDGALALSRNFGSHVHGVTAQRIADSERFQRRLFVKAITALETERKTLLVILSHVYLVLFSSLGASYLFISLPY